jgi:hypothetical protein
VLVVQLGEALVKTGNFNWEGDTRIGSLLGAAGGKASGKVCDNILGVLVWEAVGKPEEGESSGLGWHGQAVLAEEERGPWGRQDEEMAGERLGVPRGGEEGAPRR